MEHANIHIILLITALAGFFFSFIIDNRNVRLLAAFLLIISGIPYLLEFSYTNLVHIGVEWMLVAALTVPLFRIKQAKDKSIYFGMAAFICFLVHGFLPQTNSSIEHDLALDSDNEILVEFKNQEILHTWMKENSSKYKITYPVFESEDKQFKLDEYLGLDVSNKDLLKTFDKLKKDSDILHIEYNELLELKLPQSDVSSTYKNSSSINDPQLGKQWIAKEYDLEKFHKSISKRKKQQSATQTVIAILDTGIDSNHEDLKDNYVSTISTYDKDPKGHGTHCAGIAAAVTGNKIGIASWIPPGLDIKVTSITVLNSMGIGSQRTIINGILKAADSGASVISLSLGGRTSTSKEKAYKEAVRYANDKGAIVVVAAGNSSADASKYSPANTDGAITVAAVDSSFRKANFSNTIKNVSHGIYAPGTAIYSTFPDNKYEAHSGTSMAAPFVSGIIGLLKYYNPSLTTDQAYKILEETSITKNGISIIDPIEVFDSFFKQDLIQSE